MQWEYSVQWFDEFGQVHYANVILDHYPMQHDIPGAWALGVIKELRQIRM